MRSFFFHSLALLSTLPVSVWGSDILSTSGFSSCSSDGTVKVTALDVSYDRNTRVIDFNVAGESTVKQNVTAILTVTAYGKQVYNNSFSPCETHMAQMCPVPATSFASSGSQVVPQQYADEIPAIAFSIPDLDGVVKLQLLGSGGQTIGCIESTVSNGHTLTLPAISYVAAGIAAAALVLSGLSALAAGGHPGATLSSPTFLEVMGWFQGMAMNGMLSVNYPSVYRSFTTNFGFSTGLVPWGRLQIAIDNFRASTGGNLTDDSYQYLKNNATLVYDSSTTNMTKRALHSLYLLARDGASISINGTQTNIGGGSSNTTGSQQSVKQNHFVSGVEAYVEELSIPKSNTFMTVLLVWCIVVAAIIVLILLLKIILELCSLMGKLPKSLESWRKRYWWRMAKALTNLVLLLYGSWTLYCIYQFTNGDSSWAPKVLAAVTLALFTLILAGFSWRIWYKARQYKQMEGDASKLYEEKEVWIKYSLFYENYRKGYWWLFMPYIVYMFARGAIIAGGEGHGLVQTGGQLIVEGLMLILLLWTRPYQRRSGLWINIFIQVVRVLSVVCILVFVEELGVSQTTKTVTGVVLIVVQSTLTAVLAILIAINGLRNCIMENPHRRARKEAEKRNLDVDNLTSLEARNSLLMTPFPQKHLSSDSTDSLYKAPIISSGVPFRDPKGRYDPVPARPRSPSVPPLGPPMARSFSRPVRPRNDSSVSDRDHLVSGAASMGRRNDSISRSPPRERQPRLPDFDFGHAQ